MATTDALDRVSELPKNIVENILLRVPQKDAMRTSILSTKWRYKWMTLPQLVFDYPCTYKLEASERIKLVLAVYRALLIHHGPLTKFSFSVSDLDNYSDISHWLHFLSRNDIQDLSLRIWTGEHYKLPCHFYSFRRLKHLNLHNCVFKPPPTFKGLDMLISLEFRKVLFAAERFGIFLSNCPLLQQLTLEDCPHFYCLRVNAPNLNYLSFCGTFDSINLKNTPVLQEVSIALTGMAEIAEYFKDRKTSNLIEIFSSAPAIEKLSAEKHFWKFLATGTIPKRLPKALAHLKVVHLSDVSFEKIEEVSCALCLISSCPSLQKLAIRAMTNTDAAMEPVDEYFKVQNLSNCSLNQLQEIKMLHISGVKPELEFMKLLLATSTVLEKLEILPAKEKNIDVGFRVLRELIRFRRASATAEIIYLDPGLDN